jgi:aconitate hydratase
MVQLYKGPARVDNGVVVSAQQPNRRATMAYGVLMAHHKGAEDDATLNIAFDALSSHDITYVGIVQTARFSGMKEFRLPYVMTNCHNSLCAVGGTINEDDHRFGLSAAIKYGGEFVPAHMAVIHQYIREMYAGCAKMILASDSHTRYGPLGTLGIGEGGPELVNQLLGRTYDIPAPEVIGVYLTGSPNPGVGPQDVALALIRATFSTGFVKNKVLEFFGPGIARLPMDFRLGIDVMTTESACLSSIWQTDETTRQYLKTHGREDAYAPLSPGEDAVYDGLIHIALDKVEPMIALPFHPSNAFTIRELKENMSDILAACDDQIAKQTGRKQDITLLDKIKDGGIFADQGIVAGCSGGLYQNILRVDEILGRGALGTTGFSLSVYPASVPMAMALSKKGVSDALLAKGVIMRTAFCGPCFGAGDVPHNGAFSIRHTTRNFPNREGSRPGDGQVAYVALMDARSIAATAANGGRLTAATELDNPPGEPAADAYVFNALAYQSRVYRGVGKPQPEHALALGPNITDWPQMIPLPQDLDLTVASAIYDPVTTTDELIPSGETSSYRSNPQRLAEFTLSRKDPGYVGRAKAVLAQEMARRSENPDAPGLGTVVFALSPGDGSAREQAASSQRVLGGVANIASSYATRRYRANVINWGMLPFELEDAASYNIKPGDMIRIRGMRDALLGGKDAVLATLVQGEERTQLKLLLPGLTRTDREIIAAGCLMNYYAAQAQGE